jgi:hypothetical protein
MEPKQDRMLMMENILQFLCVSQEKIEESVFDETFSFERKRDYESFQKMEVELYSPPQKKKNLIMEKTNLSHRVSMFSTEKEESNSFSHSRSRENDYHSATPSELPKVMTPILYIEKKKVIKPMLEKREISEGKPREIKQYMELSESWIGGNDYKILTKRTRNRNAVFTFMDSLVSIMNESFWMKNEDDKTHLLRELLKKMHAEVYIDGNYQKFYYHKTRKMKKDQLLLTLSQSIQFRIHDMDTFYMLQQYAVDYFGVNLFIFFVTGTDEIDIERSKIFATRQFENHLNPLVPTLCMIWKDEVYYPIVHETDEEKTIFQYSRDKDFMEEIWKRMKIHEMKEFFMEKKEEVEESKSENPVLAFTMGEIQKMKLEELQNTCTGMGIPLEKISEKTGKSIKRTKTELIEQIVKYK